MPGSDGADPLCRRNHREQQSAAHVKDKRQHKPRHDQPKPAGERLPVKLTKEQRNHQRRLEGPNPAACLVNTHHPGADLDDVAVLRRRNPKEPEQFYGRPDVSPHEGLDQQILQSTRPGDGDKEEADRKDKS